MALQPPGWGTGNDDRARPFQGAAGALPALSLTQRNPPWRWPKSGTWRRGASGWAFELGLPGPGGGSEGRRLPAAPGRSAPAARGAGWLLIRAQAEVFRKTQRLQSPLGRHCALRGDQESVAKSYSVGSRSPPWPSLGGSPVTRPPPTHYAFLFLPGEGCREAETSADL